MSAGAPAIPAPGPFPGSHAPPIGQLRVARRPNRPPSGPLRAFQPQGHTPTTPLKPLSTPFPSAAASARSTAPPPTSIQCGRSVDDMARHPPHRCRIARNPTPVHSALGERLTYRLLQVQRSLSKESQTSAVTCPPQPDNSASRDDQPRPRSLTTTSHPRVSGVLRYAGDLQHRSGQPAHQYRVHGAAAGSGRALFDGRSRSLSGQCVHQAVFIKRLWRSLKYEAVYLRQLADGFMAQRVIDEWSSSPTRCDRARHSMVGRQRPSTAGSRRPDRRWRSGHGEQVAIAGSEGRGPAGAQSGKGGYPQCPQDQAPLPRTSTPFYRHLFLTARGALTITRIYLDLPPGGEPNLPLPTSIEMTPDASAVVTFHRNHWKGSPEYATKPYGATYKFESGQVRLIDCAVHTSNSGGWWAWVGKKAESGAYTDRLVSGLRVRVRNIQIDGTALVGDIFRDHGKSYGRFQDYFVGEIFVRPGALVPNARRDGFEEDASWRRFRGELAKVVHDLGREAYRVSAKGSYSVDALRKAMNKAKRELAVFRDSGFTDTDGIIALSRKVTNALNRVSKSTLGADMETATELQAIGSRLADIKQDALLRIGNTVAEQDRERLQQAARDDFLQEVLTVLEDALSSSCFADAQDVLMIEFGE